MSTFFACIFPEANMEHGKLGKCTTQILIYDLISEMMGKTLPRTSLAGQKYGVTYPAKIGCVHLVGGFNPFEKYQSNWIISPSRGENEKNI